MISFVSRTAGAKRNIELFLIYMENRPRQEECLNGMKDLSAENLEKSNETLVNYREEEESKVSQ